MFRISFVYLLIIRCTLHAKFQKNTFLRSCQWCKIGVKWPICPSQQQGPLLEISYIPLFSVMTLHYHKLYQISSLEANFSSEKIKQLCRQIEDLGDRCHNFRYLQHSCSSRAAVLLTCVEDVAQTYHFYCSYYIPEMRTIVLFLPF